MPVPWLQGSSALDRAHAHLPSKCHYADYHQRIQSPIALGEIKSWMETEKYAGIDAARQDLELCFKDAKKCNMKDSPIRKDAKHLHKIANKEHAQLTGDSLVEAREGRRRHLIPLGFSSLQKLVDRTDDEGRVISAESMEFPSKKFTALEKVETEGIPYEPRIF